MNQEILEKAVQAYISENLNADVKKIALSKSPFLGVSACELANQIAAKKKSEKKLPTWFQTKNIYYPISLSIEQTSSEATANYKKQLLKGDRLIDITAGFGVDSFYFSQEAKEVYSCEINSELSEISAHNSKILGATNIQCLAVDGLNFLQHSDEVFDIIYVDPARRNTSGKVFKLAECTPNVVEHLDMLFSKASRVIIKTSPLLDIQAGLSELKHVSEIHILSVKNECKELLWVLDKDFIGEPMIFCATINQQKKVFSFPLSALKTRTTIVEELPAGYLYEPDTALMKSGAFDYIGEQFDLYKLESQSHLYFSKEINSQFPGRIFEIKEVWTPNEFKKLPVLKGNVIVRNYPDQAEKIVKKYKITPSKDDFLIFTKNYAGNLIIKAEIIHYY